VHRGALSFDTRIGPQSLTLWQICTSDLIGAEAHRPAAVSSPTLTVWGRIGKMTSRGGSEYNYRPRQRLTVWQSNAAQITKKQCERPPWCGGLFFCVLKKEKRVFARAGSMAGAKPQGQALRVLAHSQPCPFPPAMLHLQVAMAERRSASGEAQTEKAKFFHRESANRRVFHTVFLLNRRAITRR